MTAVDTALASWNDTPTREAIVDFVDAGHCQQGSEQYVPPEGSVSPPLTMMAPCGPKSRCPFMLDFLLRRLGAMAREGIRP